MGKENRIGYHGMMSDMEMDWNTFYWYWFVNMEGIGIQTQKRLIEAFGHPEFLYTLSSKSLSEFLTEQQQIVYDESKDASDIYRSYQSLLASNSRFIPWDSADYPEKLRFLYDAPYGLYVRGKLPNTIMPTLAIVGSRGASDYGKKIAEEYAAFLAQKGVQIVSGLAAGIDAAAHRGALKSGGYTLGLLGGGIDTTYPRYNFNLYQHMYEKGGVASEYNLGVPNHAGLFPLRNRLISAISDGVFVVEARKKSGSLITADQGLEQGKDVFALPGRVTDPLSQGCNNLIAQGAYIVQRPEDILEILLENYHNMLNGLDNSEREIISNNHLMFDSMEEQRIYELVDDVVAKSFDQIKNESNYPYMLLMHTLFSLELKQYIYQPQQNLYLRVVHVSP